MIEIVLFLVVGLIFFLFSPTRWFVWIAASLASLRIRCRSKIRQIKQGVEEQKAEKEEE